MQLPPALATPDKARFGSKKNRLSTGNMLSMLPVMAKPFGKIAYAFTRTRSLSTFETAAFAFSAESFSFF
jgi:hypothetical protein